jgi:hypothetical protein
MRRIAVEYLRGWFVIDFFACFPFDQLQPLIFDLFQADNSTNSVSQSNTLVRLARLPRFYRLIRVVRLFRLLKFSQSLNTIFNIFGINKGIGKLFTVLIGVMFVVHMVSCAWYWIDDAYGFEPDSWIVR